MMLYHNLMNSEIGRLARRILMFQKDENRIGTWFTSTKEAKQCGQLYTFGQMLELSKDKWKRVWKEAIWKRDEMIAQEKKLKA